MDQSVAEAVALTQTGRNQFTSVYNVEYSGPGLEHIGYGGFCIAFGINAAAAMRSPQQSNFLVYSVTGYFVALAVTTQPLRAEVTALRDSRAFATRRVDLFQEKKAKQDLVMTLTVDFQARASRSMLTVSAPPCKRYTSPEESLSDDDRLAYVLGRNVTEQDKAEERKIVPHMKRKSERRVALEVTEDGKVKGDPRTQASVMFPPLLPWENENEEPITDRTYCHWFRFGKPVQDHLSQVLTLAYAADAGAPQTGPAFARIKRRDIAAAASLDFALRVFTNELDCSRWVMREERVVAAGEERTYTEARMFTEKGKLIAQMSEQCLLRPKEATSKI